MIRRWTVLMLVAALFLGWSGTAYAGVTFTLTDSFEAVPTNWSFSGVGNIDGEIYTDSLAARSGQRSAYLSAGGAGAWSSAAQSVQVTGSGTSCTLSVHLYPLTFGDSADQVNIEVINPTTWTYLGVRTWSTSTPSTWQTASVSFRASITNVVIRFSVLGQSGWSISFFVDDAAVSCAT